MGSNFVDMYGKCGVIRDVCMVFEEMLYKDEVSWISMIDGYVKNGDFKEVLLGFKMMLFDGIRIDYYVFFSILSVCGVIKVCGFGKCVYSIMVKLGFEEEICVSNVFVDIYSKVGDMESVSKVFADEFKCMNIVLYILLIDGYVEVEKIDKVFDIFVELRR